MSSHLDYKSSGVDIEAGDRLVDWIKSQKLSGNHKNIVGGIGGFSALFKLDLNKYKSPLLVSCTDGVGTKVKWGVELGYVQNTGVDLVAMCVNDLICCGADPLFFLDYYASGKLEMKAAQEFLRGVLQGLEESDCTLIGGETAEMPGVYGGNDYDAAGFCVGAVDESHVIDGSAVAVGDVVIGVGSSGFHSNGYSLLRKIFEKDAAEFADQLMAPTRIYVKLARALRDKVKVHAMAHITGGGLLGNMPRVLPRDTALKIQKWPWPDLFLEVQRRGELSPREMLETFNCGIGFCFVVNKTDLEKTKAVVSEFGWSHWNLGTIVKHQGEPEVLI